MPLKPSDTAGKGKKMNLKATVAVVIAFCAVVALAGTDGNRNDGV